MLSPGGGIPPPPPSLPTPSSLRGPGYDEYVLEQLRREDFYAQRVDDGKGFTNDIFNKTLAPKPFMYLDRPGVNTIKKKLEQRETMTYKEYMLAYLKMTRDPRAGQSQLIYYHMEHLQHIAEDALKRDWVVVRAWSQNTLDEIEKGTYSWQDLQTVQMERLSHALNAKSEYRGLTGGQVMEKYDRELPCRNFNGEKGCVHGGPGRNHTQGSVRYIHSCSYCMGQGAGRHPHPRTTCIRRDTDNGLPPPVRRNQSKNGL